MVVGRAAAALRGAGHESFLVLPVGEGRSEGFRGSPPRNLLTIVKMTITMIIKMTYSMFLPSPLLVEPRTTDTVMLGNGSAPCHRRMRSASRSMASRHAASQDSWSRISSSRHGILSAPAISHRSPAPISRSAMDGTAI